MTVLLTLLALSWALLQWPGKHLRRYLAAHLVSFPIVALSWHVCGAGKIYGLCYALASGLILFFAGCLAWHALDSREHRLRCLVIPLFPALALGRLAFVSLSAVRWFDWIILPTAVFLLWMGSIMAFAAPYTSRPDISLILGLFWISQGVFECGFTLHYPAWAGINKYLPQTIGIVAFLLLGWRLRSTLLPAQLLGRQRHS